ncbi:hypothetical protein LCGC14_1024010 [marine sediment metagenome]|uniref:Uncharacterized protein n=1 Tax=marine sediment metagenome TaxID=412755 RepID=A0A0F9N145_9ZZZZ
MRVFVVKREIMAFDPNTGIFSDTAIGGFGRSLNPDLSNDFKKRRFEQFTRREGEFANLSGDPEAGARQIAKSKAAGEEFVGRFRTGLEAATVGIEQELGLPGLRAGAFEAGQTARGVAEQVRGIPGTQQTIAKQVGISAPRLAQRTAAETAKLTPALSAATRGLEETQAAQQFGETEFGRRLEQFIKPFDIEAGFLGENIKQEFDLFKVQIGADLDREIANLQERGLNDRAALDRAIKAAEIEKAASEGTVQDLGDRLVLMDPRTGEIIKSHVKGLVPKRLSGPDGW